MPDSRPVVVLAVAATFASMVAAGSGGAQGTDRQLASLRASRVAGTVFDSITMRPLAQAVVQLALVPARGMIATVRSTVTDSSGRYEFPGVSPGTYLLGFQHVAADSLGLRSPVHRLDVRTESVVTASMAVPSMAGLIRTVCGRDGVKDSLSVLLGSVRHAQADTALAIVARAARLMRSPEFRDCFPPAHVTWWENGYRECLLRQRLSSPR